MSTICETDQAMVTQSDLNSVLLEGEVVRLYPPLEEAERITQVELRSCRLNRGDARKGTTSFIRVDIQSLHEQRRGELSVGRKLRVVGRLCMPHKKPALVIAEHVELKPLATQPADPR
jgi:hypothetical protein